MSNVINGKNKKSFIYRQIISKLYFLTKCIWNIFFRYSIILAQFVCNVKLGKINYFCSAKPMKECFKLITGRQILLLLLLLLLLLMLLLPPASLFPTTQTACHIKRSTGTSPLVVHGLPIRSEMPRPSADVSDSCK